LPAQPEQRAQGSNEKAGWRFRARCRMGRPAAWRLRPQVVRTGDSRLASEPGGRRL